MSAGRVAARFAASASAIARAGETRPSLSRQRQREGAPHDIGERPHLIRFFERMRGALMAAPTIVEPVMKMPLRETGFRRRGRAQLEWE